MKKLLFVFSLFFASLVALCQRTVIDGGGKTYNTIITPKGHTIYQNYHFTKTGGFFSNGVPVPGLTITNCTWDSTSGVPIMIASWGFGSYSDSVEISNCKFTHFYGSQYYVWLQNCGAHSTVHDLFFEHGNGTSDCGLVFMQQSAGDVHNIFADDYYGKVVRWWPMEQTFKDTAYNIIGVNASRYAVFELQEIAGVTDHWHVGIDNVTGGNIPGNQPDPTPTDPNSKTPNSAIVTLYLTNPAPAGANVSYSLGATKGVIGFNMSAGLLDNGGATSGAGYPTNSNFKNKCIYYSTMAAAGFANDSVLRLPDGNTWNGSKAPVLNISPTAVLNGPATDTMPSTFVLLDGSGSFDPDGSIQSFSCKQLSGPNSSIIVSSGSSFTASGLTLGVYTFQLTVTDNKGATTSTTKTVSVVSQPQTICAPPAPPCPKQRSVLSWSYDSATGITKFNYDDGTVQVLLK